jgi:hypothetical protein
VTTSVGPRLGVVALAACAIGAACGGTPAPDVAPGEFVAFGNDFQSFLTWPSEMLNDASAVGAPHAAGPRTIFINHEPPPGATAFPVGTIIVKRTEVDGKLLARAKRGGTFNPSGAVGWEWFELTASAQGAVAIRWRGFGPPLGEAYGGDPKAGCNACHKLAAANDYVLAPGLMLAPAVDGGADADEAGDGLDAGLEGAGAPRDDGAVDAREDGSSDVASE